MMEVMLFIKKLLRSRLNVMPLLILLLSIPTILFLNYKSIDYFSLKNTLIEENVKFDKDIAEINSLIDGQDETNEQINSIDQENLINAKDLKENNKKILNALEQKNYQEAYTMMANKISNTSSIVEGNSKFYGSSYQEIMEALKRDEKFYNYLSAHKLKADNIQPVFGATFMFSIWNEYMPFLFTFLIIFILSQIFASAFHDKLMIYRLIPDNYFKRFIRNTAIGSLISSTIFFLTLILAYILASLFFDKGSFNYPILIYSEKLAASWIAMSRLISNALILQLVSIITVISTIYLIAMVFKDKMLTMFVALIVILGSMSLSYILVPLQKVAHLIPYNYMQSVAVVTGQINNQIEISHLNFNSGILSNIFCILIIVAVIFIIEFKRSSKLSNFKGVKDESL
ncbi:hypothetical protein [Facklamia sp. P12932]|uniref:hypothetical protein n=1 Tax=Facklamia sp. P12932 TaxID=3421947 RepID=UPI003D16FBF8